MVGAEHCYNPVEKKCLALVFAVQKTRHYLTGQTIYVISKINPLRLLMTKSSALNGRLTKWAMLLSQYDIHFLPRRLQRDKLLRTSSQRIQHRNPPPSSKNYQM